MSATLFDLLKYAATGVASPGMTGFDKMRALAMAGGKIETLTGVPPFTFKANGKPLISLSMLGNGQQTGTPSPDNISMPTFCGKLVGSDWTIPITCGGTTTPIYLGQTPTVRKIKKLVLTGDQQERWEYAQTGNLPRFRYLLTDLALARQCVCSHYRYVMQNESGNIFVNSTLNTFTICDSAHANLNEWTQYLAEQYAAGTPVTVWYVLAEPETAIVNEPLAKIGGYADELHITNEVTIPTIKGQNTLTVDTDLQPSSVTIIYK